MGPTDDGARESDRHQETLIRRAIADVRAGCGIILRSDGDAAFVLAAEALGDDGLALGRAVSRADPALVITAQRAASLGLGIIGRAVSLAPPADADAALVRGLIDPMAAQTGPVPAGASAAVDDLAPAAVLLMKRARLLPAALLCRLGPDDADRLALARGLIRLDVATLCGFAPEAAHPALREVAAARVPLADAAETRVIAFRPDDGGSDHLAIVIGRPDHGGAVLTRIHSACFTGDLLGSLRCDCGEQLRGAIRAIAASGGGVLLYLAQEGRGIGLTNKLRAYGLQDAGSDTIDANEALGFAGDERTYQAAADMLRALGIARVRLMTNNPLKLEALAGLGIEIAERVPLVVLPNEENRAYLATKEKRSLHLFD